MKIIWPALTQKIWDEARGSKKLPTPDCRVDCREDLRLGKVLKCRSISSQTILKKSERKKRKSKSIENGSTTKSFVVERTGQDESTFQTTDFLVSLYLIVCNRLIGNYFFVNPFAVLQPFVVLQDFLIGWVIYSLYNKGLIPIEIRPIFLWYFLFISIYFNGTF